MKYLLLQKIDQQHLFWQNLQLFKNRILPLEEIIRRYDGFEGTSIGFSENGIKDLIEYLELGDNYSLLALVDDDEEVVVGKNFIFVGYDYGTCEEDQTIYSSIFNEILFGGIPILVDFKNQLNEHFLFPELNIASDYVSKHQILEKEGASVEVVDNMKIYEIWKYIVV